jgi:phosphoenolpyruvate synthase/pyruvate phosphate dikinase
MTTSRGARTSLTLPFRDIGGDALPAAGGKAVNLGELIRAGFPVPAGFCVTTTAYELVAGDVGLDPILTALATGLSRTGVNWVRVPAGKEVSIYSHYQKECVYTLSGRTVAEIDSEGFGIDAGDFVGLPTPKVA